MVCGEVGDVFGEWGVGGGCEKSGVVAVEAEILWELEGAVEGCG